MVNTSKYNISDLEKLSGIKAHTIRIWEKRYGIIQPERTDTNIRFYTDRDLQRLLNITLLNKNGFKISLISQMSDGEIEAEISKLSKQDSADEIIINTLVQASIDLEEDKLEKSLNEGILNLGFEEAFRQIVFPFLDRIALLWQLGKMNACQERFVVNLIKHKLVVAIDGLVGQSRQGGRHFLLFLSNDEFNELPLLFANYLLRKKGHHVTYLGPGIPLDHLRRLKDKDHYDGIITSFQYTPKEKELQVYLSELSKVFDNKQVVVHFERSLPDFKCESANTLLSEDFSWTSFV